MIYRNVNLEMIDTLTGKTVFRTIDITNAMTSGSECYELRGPSEQRKGLNNWIKERGNQQHDTILELKNYTLI